jgi:hypothetical protein
LIQVVLGKSLVTNANSTFNLNLWWALEGGGATWSMCCRTASVTECVPDAKLGIVTRFDVERVENSLIWFERLITAPDQLEEFIWVAINFAAVAAALLSEYALGHSQAEPK